jgi:hypothetical protein
MSEKVPVSRGTDSRKEELRTGSSETERLVDLLVRTRRTPPRETKLLVAVLLPASGL